MKSKVNLRVLDHLFNVLILNGSPPFAWVCGVALLRTHGLCVRPPPHRLRSGIAASQGRHQAVQPVIASSRELERVSRPNSARNPSRAMCKNGSAPGCPALKGKLGFRHGPDLLGFQFGLGGRARGWGWKMSSALL